MAATYFMPLHASKRRKVHESIARVIRHRESRKDEKRRACYGLCVLKLPSLKELQSEYAELLGKKKLDYAAYRAARDEMRELLMVKANVDSILRHDAPRDQRRDAPTA